MLRVFDYLCPNGHRTEMFTSEVSETTECMCGEKALRQMSTPRVFLEGVTGDFPGAAMKWDKKHAEQLKVEKKRNSS